MRDLTKTERILDICAHALARRQGVTLNFVVEEYGVSRRTAQRMMQELEKAFDVVPFRDHGGRHYWKLDRGSTPQFPRATADDLAALELGAKALSATGASNEAERAAAALTYIQAQQPPNIQRRIGPDLDALLVSQGLATHPHPIEDVDRRTLDAVTFALKTQTMLTCRYQGQSGKTTDLRLAPYGVILGARRYLAAIAFFNGKAGELYRYRIASMHEARNTDEPFVRDPDFDLDLYSSRSFGSYYSDAEYGPVILRFSGPAAARARRFHFHPDQAVSSQGADTIIEFKAAGWVEIAWHLGHWGRWVQVIAPDGLRALHEQEFIDVLP